MARVQTLPVGSEAPIQNDNLPTKCIEYIRQRVAQIGVKPLPNWNAAPVHEQIDSLPKRQNRHGIAYQGQAMKRLSKCRQKRRKQRIVFDDEREIGRKRFPHGNFALPGSTLPQTVGWMPRNHSVMQPAVNLHRWCQPLRLNPRTRLHRELVDASAGRFSCIGALECVLANGFGQANGVWQFAR